jgi:triosephosphate isomerase (TIM)
MNVVLCIGETLEEFEKKLVGAVCEVQLKKNLAGVSAEDMKKVTIAYEVRTIISYCTLHYILASQF